VEEGLSQLIATYKRDGFVKGIKMGTSISLSHLLFVDDAILFGAGTRREEKKVKKKSKLIKQGNMDGGEYYQIFYIVQWFRRGKRNEM
jgi:hypothetical protein